MFFLVVRNIERVRKIDCILWIFELLYLFILFVDCVFYIFFKLIVIFGYNEDEYKLLLLLNVGKIIIYV